MNLNLFRLIFEKLKNIMSTIKINGNVVNGVTVISDLSISNGRVTVNGKDVTPGDAKVITVEIVGDVEKVSVDACNSVKITGNVTNNVKTMSGDVKCGDVGGNVDTMSGDIDCGKIGGSVKTMSGDITTR